jgi:phosphohistidine swiveling domain-containing protein
MISRSWAPRSTEVSEVGGKGASLLRLAALGRPVPRFFVITAAEAVAHGDGRVSPGLRTEIIEAWREIGGESHPVAVRSSSLAEDSADHSFAGVFETVLNVRDADSLVRAIECCWRSRDGAAAVAYRAAREAGDEDRMAVVVQRMVDATWSGVCFTADPIAQALSVTVVNATPGIGDDLVSGLITPEEIKLDTRSGRIIDRRVATGQEPIPDRLLRAVVAEATAVAAEYGFPQDVEWAVEGDQVQLLQSRPITTLAGVLANRPLEPWGPEAQPDRADRVWTRAYADEIWTPPVSPLFYDLQNLTGQIALQLRTCGDFEPVPPDVFKYFRAAPYLDAAQLERIHAFQPKLMRLPPLLNVFPPERAEPARRAAWKWWGLLRRAWLCEIVHGPRRGFTRNHRFLQASWEPFENSVAPLLATDEAALSDERLDGHLEAVWRVAGTIGAECGIAVFYYAHDLRLLLSALLTRWCGDGEALYAAVSGGVAASSTVRESDAIWRLADLIRAAGPQAREFAARAAWAGFADKADQVVGPAFRREFDGFLRSHGHRGANYKDPIHPRWGDEPELLWRHVQAALYSDHGRPSEANRASAAARNAAQDAVLSTVRGSLATVRRAVLRWLFKYNEIYMGLRDGHRFYYDYIWWLLRRVYVEKGRRLHACGLIGEASDVFFMVRKEIGALSEGTLDAATAATRIAVRRAEWEQTRIEQPPKFLRRGYLPDDEPLCGDADGLQLSGTAASPGQVRGRARVIYDVSELNRLQKGDILVTRQTDPAWTPTFAHLGGLVLETGGVLAHGASLCREFDVPCVTTVERATSRISDGAMLFVDGGQGIVRILAEEPASEASRPQ